ncbi:3-hydroxyacyl-CoA dehydrogenase NAD-binding domain-containing protein [Aquicella lusitana]|uniref:enoyl-CoA hydratase n=1 Tax=Aquicella lusitana TaxID=254246 RepID=A0A370GQR0_9COXI|nr:short chain enoyl-CoA hydratase /3-hydroxyacyl-CoA dehydrogenase [Aquicella lusitana]VVC73351.1 Fatty acid oxidation complex subunit alpha [Aquicella lusitana]
MSMTQTYKNWRLETDADQILWLYFDKENASVNTIDRGVMEELAAIVDTLATDKTHKGVIIASGKKTGFIAGADIAQFTRFKDLDEALFALTQGQNILNKLEALKMPSVAMIDGFCLGGGMELALACTYRVAEESSKTRLGLPEVKLGIHPGWGGTVRMPRLVGALQGMNMVLTGATVSGKAAAKIGFVDAAVPKRQLVHAAKYYVLERPAPHKPTTLQALSNKKIARQIIGSFLRKKVKEKINPLHYPAPFHALDNWEHIGVEDSDAAYAREAKSCAKLFFSDTCQNLVRVFFLQERMKGLAKEVTFEPKHIHVIGAGTMGGDIAAWCALRGYTVTLQDLEPRLVAPAIKRAYALFKEKLKERYLIQAAMDRLIPDVNGNGVAKADIIIEAVLEDLSIKQNLFRQIESKAKPSAILATNTSSIPLDEINTVLQSPERLVGIHFFNPVAKMLLVEVVKGDRTSQEVVDKAISFVRKIDRLPLPVKSSPGFLVNRILMPYLLESVELLKEGVPATAIDKAMTNFGMPMGPITLADTVGLDVCLSVAKYLGKYFHTSVPQGLIELVEKRKLGRKTGEGFYKYDKRGKQIKPEEAAYDRPLDEISNRLVLRMLNESFACLREGVVADGDLLDAGMIFGTGFAPFRGGPIHYAKSQGISELYQQYLKQRQAKGEKTDVLESWEAMTA